MRKAGRSAKAGDFAYASQVTAAVTAKLVDAESIGVIEIQKLVEDDLIDGHFIKADAKPEFQFR